MCVSESNNIFDLVKIAAQQGRADIDDHGGVPPLLKRDPELAMLAELAKKDTIREKNNSDVRFKTRGRKKC